MFDFFKKIKCFRDLKISNSDLHKGIGSFTCLWMPKHQVLFREGDRGRNFYVQLSGKSQLFLPNPERAAIKMQISDLVDKIEANQKIIKGIDSYKEVNVTQSIER